MNPDLTCFAIQWLRVALMALAPVLFAAFVSLPMTLGAHPGETMARTVPSSGHMT